jgi:XTP/dITP diphosphohydrolase
MSTIYLASKNQHKADEIQAILGASWQVAPCTRLSSSIDWVESGTTFRANARIKAMALRDYTAELVLADDSGLEVEVLNGAPGVYSARYAGERSSDQANLEKLLKVLRGLPLEQRAARFVCVLCLIDRDGTELYFEGSCSGRILEAPRGQGGFGYDPIFQPEGYEASFAELSAAEKNRLSHRSQALRGLMDYLAKR